MKKREQMFAKINKGIGVFFCVFGVAVGGYQLFNGTAYLAALGFLTIAFLFLPAVLYKVLRLRALHSLTFLIYLFSFLSFSVGMSLQAYHWLPFYDKAVHTLSGLFFAFLGLVLFYVLKEKKEIAQSDFPLVASFSFCFSMAVAALWEIYEYFLEFLMHTDPQNVLTTGVSDTMIDIIVCLIGTLILEVLLYRYYKKNKTDLVMGMFEDLFARNFKK